MALGQILKEARERKGVTPRQVAEATRMLVQIVEDLERENFRRIAAPLYGRGFIKLYAEFVGVDPQPLVAEFMEIFTGKRPPQVARREIPPSASATTQKTATVKSALSPEPAVTKPVPPPVAVAPKPAAVPKPAVVAKPAASAPSVASPVPPHVAPAKPLVPRLADETTPTPEVPKVEPIPPAAAKTAPQPLVSPWVAVTPTPEVPKAEPTPPAAAKTAPQPLVSPWVAVTPTPEVPKVEPAPPAAAKTALQPLVSPWVAVTPTPEVPKVEPTPPAAAKAAPKPVSPPPQEAAEPAPAVMPLDVPVPELPPDLFTLAEQQRPPMVKPVASRSITDCVPSGQPRVRPFSGERATYATPAVELPAPAHPPAARTPQRRLNIPLWTKPRVMVREVAKIWRGVPRIPMHWLTPRRLALAAGVVAGAAIVILGIRALMSLAERSASRPEPVLSQQVLPPPQPYVQ